MLRESSPTDQPKLKLFVNGRNFNHELGARRVNMLHIGAIYILALFHKPYVSFTVFLLSQSSLCTHTQTQTRSLEGDPLPASPHSFWAACSVGTGAWMNDLEISLFQMTGERKWSCESGPLCFPRFIHKKKAETEVWPHPAHSSYHPHTRNSTDVTSCLCHRADCIVVSDWIWLSAFPLPLLFRSLMLFFLFFPLSPCPPLFLFCFHEQQRDARVTAGDILPLSGHLKRKLPLPPIPPLE